MAEVHLLELLEVGLPVVFGQEVVVDYLCAKQFRETCIGGIAGIGHENFISDIDKCQSNMQDALLAAYEGLYFAVGIEVDTIPAFVESAHCLAQLGYAHGGLIPVCCGFLGFLAECFDCFGRGRHIGASDGEADDVFSFGVHCCHFFQFATEVILCDVGQSVGRPDVKCFVFHFRRCQVV